MIAGYSVDNKTDVGHLREVSDEAKELLNAPSIEVLADKGYDSNQDILDCLMNGTIANVSIKEEKEYRHIIQVRRLAGSVPTSVHNPSSRLSHLARVQSMSP